MTTLVRLEGGIGNQMFQMAFARSRALINNSRTIIDTNYFTNSSATRSLLPWNCQEDEFYCAPRNLEVSFVKNRLPLSIRIHNHSLPRVKFSLNQKSQFLPMYREDYRQFVYDFLVQPNGYYSGTFASHLYWGRGNQVATSQWLLSKLKGTLGAKLSVSHYGVSIHARRGDYVTNHKTRNFHGYIGIKYYIEAIELLAEKGMTQDGVLVACDDHSFAQEIARYVSKHTKRVGFANTDNPNLALYEISHADSFIGSNSTFSFWASQLVPKELTIFPSNWFVSPKMSFEPQKLFPGSPILLDTQLLT